MAATVLQLNSRMKKKIKRKHPIRGSDIPVTLKYMRAFEERLMKRFDSIDARFESMNARFDSMDKRFEATDAKLESLDKKIDSVRDELKSDIHQVVVLSEEQNFRNKQAYDGYFVTYAALEDLRSNLKPECLKD